MVIVILGNKQIISQAPDCHDELVNFHSRVIPSRFQWNLEQLVLDPPINPHPRYLPDYPEYLKALETLSGRHSIWSVYDHRLVFFLPAFTELVKDCRVLWADTFTDKQETDYIKSLQKLNKAVFDGFEGHKLHLTDAGDREAIRGLLLLKPKEEEGKAKKDKS